MHDGTIRIELLGAFRVRLPAGTVESGDWPTRRSAQLVALLALADGHRLTREQVIEALWPDLDPAAGAANVRKAAHHARQALRSPDAVVLRGGDVRLLPGRTVRTDVAAFEAQAREALSLPEPATATTACAAAAASYAGELLPDARYEEWAAGERDRLRRRYVELLRRGRRWEQLVDEEPTDEVAHRELMRRDLAAGNRPSAIRWYGRLCAALRHDLGVLPDAATQALYDACVEELATDAPEFVGREVEQARVLATLRTGTDDMIVVRGPGGIGKSVFCGQVARSAREDGRCVVPVVASEADEPYAALARVVDAVAAGAPAALEAVGGHARSVLATLTPLVPDAAARTTPLTRHEVIGAMRRLLLAAGGGRPVLLVVDDAHLADAATLDAVLQLAEPRIAVLLAHRPAPAPEALADGVARLQRARRAVEIDLGPLDPQQTAALIARVSPVARSAEAVERLVTLSEGNPFLAVEAARSPVAGLPSLVGSARDAIVGRLVDVGAETTTMLERLALAGDAIDPAGAVALTGEQEDTAFPMLDRALSAGVLVVVGGRYRFRHELVRQALLDRVAPHRRVVAHREVARRLAEAGAPAGSVARHWLAGGRPVEAQPWLLAAARAAVRVGAYADALAELDALLAVAPGDADGLRLRAEALDARGDAAAPAAYAEAARRADTPTAAELRAKQALATIKLGDPVGGLEVLGEVEPTTVDGRLAHALALCGAAALGFGDPERGAAKAAEVRRLALRSEDPTATVVASWANAAAAHARGDLRGSVWTDLHETRALPALAVNVFDGQLCITQRLLYGARPYADVIAFADAFATEAIRLGAARGHAFAVTIRGEANLLAGRLEAARADLDSGVRLHHEIGAATGEAFALQRRAEVALQDRELGMARSLLEESLAVARESEVGFHLFDRIYGTRILAAPDPTAGLAAVDEAEAAVRGPIESCPGCRITLAVPAAIAAARAGDVPRARHWAGTATYLADVVMRLPAWSAALEEVRGHLALATGDPPAAGRHFRAAADGFAAAGQPADQARCATLTTR